MIDDLTEQLRHIIAEKMDVNIKLEEIPSDAVLLEEGLGLDSIAIAELINLIEDNFGFQFSDEDLNLETFNNLQTLAQFIASRLTSQPG